MVEARQDLLVLASVKSFFGSRGVVAEHVMGTVADPRGNRGYAMLNNTDVRSQILEGASKRFGYDEGRIQSPL